MRRKNDMQKGEEKMSELCSLCSENHRTLFCPHMEEKMLEKSVMDVALTLATFIRELEQRVAILEHDLRIVIEDCS